ncbi:NADPH:adrenodoxin oxidoreductase, mitochondrial isoform X1 [Solanum lycopersicum]|uniref:NADPH:adrenodoxin oxidoreductase, mitochondrial isoform X1 n=1 Tax=Solanum lycopersicum TaxID=4081 RepID=UPI000532C280|nr:NADPH:adrenodoxin oxidoreductase, mitochondrial isoform X1 [Solanum lycopersicum]XP_010314057.1 NADPH:adrenodoxin oxidoreductase, mitochondrial isoform X1 [Solanum lycopersicum]
MALSRALNFCRSFSTVSSEPLRVCIVGSGPAGFYTADKILKAHEGAEVDIVDRLPTPFGLVRSGVAPDHPETKVVTNQFSRVAQNRRCSFIGNVSLGASISLAELRELYDAVVLSYGAESDQALGIPREDLSGIYAAREFVWWYNGHPDCRNLAPDLKSSDTAVIIGQGNVALDVARILLRPTSELATTDISCHALAALSESSIRKVYLVGRRGAAQAAFTAKELREVLRIKDLSVGIRQADLSKTPVDEEELKNNRIKRRIHELLSKAATPATSECNPGQKELHFVFFRKPDRFLESDCRSGHVGGLRMERTILKEDVGSGKQIAVGTGLFEEMECGLVLKSVGYKSIPVAGLPFDHRKGPAIPGIVPNVQGRVLSEASEDALVEKGLYVCGWLKRGPTGIIATNLYCAEETVASISEDVERGVVTSRSGLSKSGREGLLQLLDSRNVKIVPFGGWEKIESEEKRRGSLKNKPREKLTSWEDLLEVATK